MLSYILQGLNDQYGSLYHIEALEKNVRNIFEKLLIDNCKHSPHLEFESLVLKKIKSAFKITFIK